MKLLIVSTEWFGYLLFITRWQRQGLCLMLIGIILLVLYIIGLFKKGENDE